MRRYNRIRTPYFQELLTQARPLDLGLAALGDVAHDRRGGDDRPIAVTDRRDRQRDIDQRAVLSLPNRLEVEEMLSRHDLLE